MNIDETPDYLKMVDDSYKEQQQELAKQEKAAKYKQYGAIFADMANLAGDAMRAKGGLNVNARNANYTDEAMKRREAYTQARGAMKAQYAKDRMAAHAAQRRDALQQQQLAAQEAYREQQQKNWQNTFDANQGWKTKELAAQKAYREQQQKNFEKQLMLEKEKSALRAINGKEDTQGLYDAAIDYTSRYPELQSIIEETDPLSEEGEKKYNYDLKNIRAIVAAGRRLDAAKAGAMNADVAAEMSNALTDFESFRVGNINSLNVTTFANESIKKK